METKFTVSFDIYNTESVKRLQEEDPDILPSYSVDAAQDLAYNKKQISAAITAGIIQGKSIDHIADDLQSRIETMNRASAIRTARTAITNAQNAGTLASMKRLAALGVEVQKEWMATLDSRTRESHRNLDGERRELDERFSNGLMYPGASGSAKEVYNCRCTMVSYLPKYDSEDEPRVTYSEWTEYKKATGSTQEKITGETYSQTKYWSKGTTTTMFHKRRSQFSSQDDPMAEITGSAYDSNPEEIEQIKNELTKIGVEINEESESIGYGCTAIGHPGVLSINRLASYSAWLHELCHIEDDKASGWQGVKVLFDVEKRIEWERRAYQKEIDYALNLGLGDIAERLKENLENEIRTIRANEW